MTDINSSPATAVGTYANISFESMSHGVNGLCED